MNWAERFGIVGAYFFILLSAFLISIYDINYEILKVSLKASVFIIALFFPIGYIIIEIGQWLYYICHPWQLDIRVINKMKRTQIKFKNKDIQNNYREIGARDQLNAEAFLTYINKTVKINVNENVQTWIQRRNYAVAVNSAIILASTIAFGLLFIILIYNNMYKLFPFLVAITYNPNPDLLAVIVTITYLLNAILWNVNNKLIKLISDVYYDYTLNSLGINNNRILREK